ncbi:MAG: uracil-DNA glycosylase, partial [Victivallaceae bacterium]|nr:uracil-DNA glycosylase [Victivallaceae bacterium]
MNEDSDFYSELINAVKLAGGGNAPTAVVWTDFSAWTSSARPSAAVKAPTGGSRVVPERIVTSINVKAAAAAPLPVGGGVAARPNAVPASEEAWRQLETEAAGCSRCDLRAACRQVVFGEGSRTAELMFIGEGPGAEEDAQGRPFVGPAGQLLDRMIAAMQYRRDEVYIANIVKCRPPGNRVPEPLEAVACSGYLNR